MDERPSLRRAARTVLSVAAWVLLMLAVLFTGYFLLGVLLAAVLLGSGPSSEAPIAQILLVLVLITGALAWVVARYIASARIVGLAIAITLAVMVIVGTTWALSSPDGALFSARGIAWGESDVKDYQKFPQRQIDNAGPTSHFKRNLSPELFQTIEYRSDGELKKADFEGFLRSTQTTSFIVIKDDAILYERYFNGYKRDSIVTSFSMAKSFTSALVGIAIDEDYIDSVDDLMIDYLPEMRGKGLDGITIRHLLTMSSGIRYVPDDDVPLLVQLTGFTDDALHYYYPNIRSLVLQLPPDGTQAGTRFNYNNYYPQLLGMILERNTRRPVSQYFQQKIWQPLGMEFPASWSLDSKESGFEQMTVGINARAIDFAKFGRLFLEQGNWNGRQIISRNWVIESTSPDPTDTRPWDSDEEWKEANGYYKYLWWGILNADGSYDYVARGHLGQRIFVSPGKNAIAVRFGFTDEGVDSWDDVLASVLAKVK